jgi:hypothetical protein
MDDYFPNSNANGRSHQTKLKKSNKDNKSSPAAERTNQLQQRSKSINITEEALRIGKVPTE